MKKSFLSILFLLISGILFTQTSYNVNDRVEVLYQGKWYKATVLKTDGAKAFVHWDGYASSYDSWAKPEEIRKLGSTAETSSSSSASSASSPTATTGKYKVGDKIMFQGYDGNFPTGTITKFQDGWYYVDVTDGSDKQVGLNGMREKSIFPVWQYKEFFKEVRDLLNTNSMVSKLARMVCDQCYPSGQLSYGYQIEEINKAKEGYNQLKEIVKKYQPLPATGTNYFTSDPALVGKVSSKSDSVIAAMLSENFKDRMRYWFEASMYIYDLSYPTVSTDHVLFDGKSFADFVFCGSLKDLKAGLIKNLETIIKQNSLSGTPEEYLKGFDENFEKRKTKLYEEANDNSWVKSDYPYVDNSMNGLLAYPSLKTLNAYYNATTFTVHKDDAGFITEQAKGGVVIYQKPGCDYWMWQYITAYKEYLGNGKYAATKMRLMDYGFIKPF